MTDNPSSLGKYVTADRSVAPMTASLCLVVIGLLLIEGLKSPLNPPVAEQGSGEVVGKA